MNRASASPRVLMLTSVLASLGMILICGTMLMEMRQEAWERSDQAATNLLQAVAGDIARNIELFDLSLQGAVEGVTTPAVMAASSELRQMILFDRAATARGLGPILVLDTRGEVVAHPNTLPRPTGSFADREYFTVHRDRSVGLHISEPFASRVSGDYLIALSRRIDGPDGAFAGVVVGTIRSSYIKTLFDSVDLGRDGALALIRDDGAVLLRKPGLDDDVLHLIERKGLLRTTQAIGDGRFVNRSASDGIERAVAVTRIGSLPLHLAIATSVEGIVGPWRAKAITIGLAVLALVGTILCLAALFRREIVRRARAETAMAAANAELAALSMTDALTGLANRRRFDAVLEREHRRTRRVGQSLALVVLDVDHFKVCNDRHGHAVGDLVLKDLGRTLAASLRRPGDLACRIGGEEFAVILPDTDDMGAAVVAAAIHGAIARMPCPAGDTSAPVTVSIGVACAAPGDDPAALFVAADAALYEAKRRGRDRTEFAHTPHGEDSTLVA